MLCTINIVEEATSQKYEDFYIYLLLFEEDFDNKNNEKYWGVGLKRFEPAIPYDGDPIHNHIDKMNIYLKDTNKWIYQELDIIPITQDNISNIIYDYDLNPSKATIILTSPKKTINILNNDFESLKQFIENLSIFKNGNPELCNSEEIKFKIKSSNYINDSPLLNNVFNQIIEIYLKIPYSNEIVKLLRNCQNLKKVIINNMFRYDSMAIDGNNFFSITDKRAEKIVNLLPENLEYFGYTYQKCSQLPENVEKFKKLTTLDLSGNYLWKLPNIITLFPNLKKLILNDLIEPMVIIPVKFIKILKNISIEYSISTPENCDNLFVSRIAEMAKRLYCNCDKEKNPFKEMTKCDNNSYQNKFKECNIDDSIGDLSEDDDSSLNEEDTYDTFICDGCQKKTSFGNHKCFFVWGPLSFFNKNIIFKNNLQECLTKILYVFQMCDKCKIDFFDNEYDILENYCNNEDDN
uniref:Leucine-rich repeat protein n=1 Tax=Strongyloides stercoralis TaxID=6248 RepID=A0A0K0E7I5_STRER